MNHVRVWPVCIAVILSGAALGRDQPRFDKYHVVPHGSSFGPGTLTTGQFVSILGWHLTPESWCDAPHSPEPPYPLTLCGVHVLVGGHLAPLMYAGPIGNRMMNADQVNFQVPANVEAEGEASIQVCAGAACSDPLGVPFTNKDILLRVSERAYVHMPLWVEFTIPFNNNFEYPASPCPWDFGGFRIEVRKDGHDLPSSAMPACAETRSSYSAISLAKGGALRLPAHLFHVFQTPGEYEIRMSGPLLKPDLSGVSRTGYSDWLPVTVEPRSEAERQAWLDSIAAATSSGNMERRETEFIVSLLALADEKALKALMGFLPPTPPPDPVPARRIVKGNLRMNWPRDCLAPAALAAFPEGLLKQVIPPARLVKLRETPGYCFWR